MSEKTRIDSSRGFGKSLEPVVIAATASALDRHRRLGETVVIWRDGRTVTLTPDEIESLLRERQSHTGSRKTEPQPQR